MSVQADDVSAFSLATPLVLNMSTPEETNRLLTEIRDLLEGQKNRYAEYLEEHRQANAASQKQYQETTEASEKRHDERCARWSNERDATYVRLHWRKQIAWMVWATVVIVVLFLVLN